MKQRRGMGILGAAMVVVALVGGSAARAGESAETSEARPEAKATERRLFNVVSSIPLKIYGFIKFDAAWDDSRTSTGNFARWVESEATNDDDDELNVTARETRLGLQLLPRDVASFKASGKVEIDFYGAGGGENKADVMMRHAYFRMDWEDRDLSLLVGQTWDVVGPLNPRTLNYTVLWWNGNVGYRRPQVRLTQGFSADGLAERFELQAAITRNIGHDCPFDPGDTGEDAGHPGLQGRASVSLDLLTDTPTVLGVGASWHREEYDTTDGDENVEYDSDSLVVDLSLPVTDELSLKGEFFTGRNIDALLGGIGQGINTVREREIDTRGGWVAAAVRPRALEDWTFNLGIGVDDPDDGDLEAGARSRNLAVYGNAIWSLGGGISTGLELTRLETKYKGQDDADATRVQFSMIYKF